MKIERVAINKLKPASYNPRQISTKQDKDLKEICMGFKEVLKNQELE